MIVQKPAASYNWSQTCWLTRGRYWHTMVLQRLQVNKFGPFLVTASGVLSGHAKDKRHRKDERSTSAYFPYNFSGVCPVSKGVWLPEHKRGWRPGNHWWNRVFAIVLSHHSNKDKAARKSMEKSCYCSAHKIIMTHPLSIWEMVFQFSLTL